VRFRERDPALLASRGTEAPGPWYTFYPAGGAVMVDRARFLEIGGFDPLFHPFYYEDLDLAFRAWRRGWCCRVVPESRLVHAAGSTISKAFPKRDVLVVRRRNRLLFLWKNLTSDALLWRSFGHQALRVPMALLRGDTIPLAATWAALRRLPTALARRRIEKRAELQGYAESREAELPPSLVAVFAEEPVRRNGLAIDHFPGFELLEQCMAEWGAGRSAGAFLVTGEPGIG